MTESEKDWLPNDSSGANHMAESLKVIFTEQQIEDICAELREYATSSPSCNTEMYVLLQRALQIIRQLQGDKQDLRFELSDYQVEFGDTTLPDRQSKAIQG